jgi:hypothetical protein
MKQRMFVIAALVIGAACASSPAHTGDSGNPDVITAAELADPAVAAGDALQAVQRLRPRFLMSRGMTSSASNGSAGGVHASIDGGPLVAVTDLQRVRPSSLKEIRYLSATDAAQRFGAMAGNGPVIILTSR